MNKLFLHVAAGAILYLSAGFIVIAEEFHVSPFVAELKLQCPTFRTIAPPRPFVISVPSHNAGGYIPKTIEELAKAPADNAVWQIRPVLLKTGPAPDLWSAPAERFIGKYWK
jgi:hypothetical protein